MSLTVISGPMFSGKTSELIRRVERAKIADKEVMVFNSPTDTRSGIGKIETHKGETIEAHSLNTTDRLKTVDADVVAIDEVQFMNQEIVCEINNLAKGAEVIVAGLCIDFKGASWRPTTDLMAIADNVIKLTAICEECGDKANFVQRLHDGEPANVNENRVYIGGNGSYEARCRIHHEVKT